MRKKDRWVIHNISTGESKKFDIKTPTRSPRFYMYYHIKRSYKCPGFYFLLFRTLKRFKIFFAFTKNTLKKNLRLSAMRTKRTQVEIPQLRWLFSNTLKGGLSVLISVLVIYGVVHAGTITPPSGTPAAQFYSLSEIYNFITANTTATEGSPALDWSATLEGTGRTLTEIYDALASLISADKVKSGTTYLNVAGTLVPSGGTATTSNVLSGKTYFGDSQTNWTLQTGTMTNNGAFSLTANSTDQSITAGYYSGGTLAGDADLATGNIKKGVNIFSTTGAYSGYPGTGWSGTAITQAACDAQNPTWYWFADGNGDGDTTDPEDGVCVRATTVTSLSWNGSEQMAATAITAQAATAGTANSITKDSAGWTANAYTDMVVDITSGTASGCWGIAKSNTTDTITVYGSWLSSAYASSCGTPDATSVFSVEDDGFALYDNSWIGDWTCTGSFPSGAPSWGSYPTSAKAGSGNIALAIADCYDGTRDLLPTEASRAVKTGTATAADATTITDTAQSLNTNAWVGQKVLITGGTGSGGYGRIESNIGTVITVDSWTGGTPDVGSTFAIVYLIPHASYNPTTDVDGNDDTELNGNNGPLTQEVLNNWKGTRLPTASDFFGFCGYKDGGSNYESTTGTYTADKTYGNYGGQVGRTDEFLDLANSGSWEWLSEQHNQNGARVAGNYACSNVHYRDVHNGYRFRAVFRP